MVPCARLAGESGIAIVTCVARGWQRDMENCASGGNGGPKGMDIARVISLGFRFISGFALLVAAAAVGFMVYNLHFALNAEVRPGEFLAYHAVRIKTRVLDSNGSYRDSFSEEYRPSFRYTGADGVAVTVSEGEAHVVTYLDPGDAIEVLIDAGGARTPVINGFIPLYGDGVVLLLVAGLFFWLAEFARRKVLRLFTGERPDGRPAGPFARLLSVSTDVGGGAAAAPSTKGDTPAPRPRPGAGRRLALVLAVALLGVALFAFLWLGEDTPPAPAPVDAQFGAGVDVANLPPPELPPEEAVPAAAEPAPPAGNRTRSEPSAVERAARRGDAVELARLLAAGGSLADVRPAIVKTLIARGDVETLRVVFSNGFDLSQRYARQTFGDQAVSARKRDVVRLVREFGGLFEAPPEFVALAGEDLPALRAVLAERPGDRRWRGMSIDSFARKPAAKALLEQARAP